MKDLVLKHIDKHWNLGYVLTVHISGCLERVMERDVQVRNVGNLYHNFVNNISNILSKNQCIFKSIIEYII